MIRAGQADNGRRTGRMTLFDGWPFLSEHKKILEGAKQGMGGDQDE